MVKNLPDVRAHAWFAAGEGHGEHANIGDLVQESANLSGREFMGQGLMGGVVAMDASKVTAVGQLKGHTFRPAQRSRFGRDLFEKTLSIKLFHDATSVVLVSWF
ncbi:MAG: hypothetical protein OEU99_10705 [Nitrospira sp.]|nr:hypothetical protein [Nitrospira sp.]